VFKLRLKVAIHQCGFTTSPFTSSEKLLFGLELVTFGVVTVQLQQVVDPLSEVLTKQHNRYVISQYN
jgi:hypothetical protein